MRARDLDPNLPANISVFCVGLKIPRRAFRIAPWRLLEEYEQGNIQFRNAPLRDMKYHYCCLSKALSLGPTTSKLLRAAGIEHELIDVCCGGAGVWGTFKENYDMSSEIAGKLRNVIHPECMILTESETCRLQIEAQVTTQVHFPLELLISRIQRLGENSND